MTAIEHIQSMKETKSENFEEIKARTIRTITYIHEPTELQCGQAVLAMLTDLTAEQVVRELNNDRETTLKEMKALLRAHGVWISDERIQVSDKKELPEHCLLSLETPRCWHWLLYSGNVFYDPEHGMIDDFPESERRYYWKIRF